MVARHEDWFDESDVCSQIRVPFSAPLRDDTERSSNPVPNPMTRLWQNAGDRQTGAEAVEAIRARQHVGHRAEKTSGRWNIFRHGR